MSSRSDVEKYHHTSLEVLLKNYARTAEEVYKGCIADEKYESEVAKLLIGLQSGDIPYSAKTMDRLYELRGLQNLQIKNIRNHISSGLSLLCKMKIIKVLQAKRVRFLRRIVRIPHRILFVLFDVFERLRTMLLLAAVRVALHLRFRSWFLPSRDPPYLSCPRVILCISFLKSDAVRPRFTDV